MKTKKLINVWSLRLFIVLTLNSFFLQMGVASNSSTDLRLVGN